MSYVCNCKDEVEIYSAFPSFLFFLQWHFGLKPHVVGVMYLLLLLYSTKTLMRNYEWSNTQQLVEAALRVNPQNAKVLVAMGNILAQQVIGRDATHRHTYCATL